jgi:hypothetical protein
VVCCEASTEGGVNEEMSGGHLEVIDPTVGQTAKTGTDEQKPDMMHKYMGKQPHPCNAQNNTKNVFM